MRKVLVLMACVLIFIACDFAKESVKIKPDIEITYLKPVAVYISLDSLRGTSVAIEEIHFVPKNSVDCTIDRMLLEYYSMDSTRFFGPIQVPIYLKIKGIVNPEEVDTTKLFDVQLPLDTVLSYMLNPQNPRLEAKALLQFISYDDYDEGTCDTATCWFGFYRTP